MFDENGGKNDTESKNMTSFSRINDRKNVSLFSTRVRNPETVHPLICNVMNDLRAHFIQQ